MGSSSSPHFVKHLLGLSGSTIRFASYKPSIFAESSAVLDSNFHMLVLLDLYAHADHLFAGDNEFAVLLWHVWNCERKFTSAVF